MNINASLFGQGITFAILIWFTTKFVWPPLMRAMEERAKKISEGLSFSEQAKQDLELAKKHASEILKETKMKSSEIVSNAETQANQIIERARATAREEAERIRAEAEKKIEQSRATAMEEIRSQVADLVIEGVQKLLRSEIDPDRHGKILNELRSRV